jgi:hypothetical protein
MIVKIVNLVYKRKRVHPVALVCLSVISLVSCESVTDVAVYILYFKHDMCIISLGLIPLLIRFVTLCH